MFSLSSLIATLIAAAALMLLTRRAWVGLPSAAILLAILAILPADELDSAPGPNLTPREEFATSSACRSCHPGEYATWHNSFHRTMTQIASDTSVLAEFEGTLSGRGTEFELRQYEGRHEVRLATPDSEGAVNLYLPDGWTPIVMTTGSHHMQAYWVDTPDGYYSQFPFMWLIEEERWIPTDDSFIRPHADEFQDYDWLACAQCHATDHSPRQDADGRLDFRVTELGIACEACHGPASEHIAANQNPLRRYAMHLGDSSDPTVVEPSDLSTTLTSQVCGQCHARVLPIDEDYARHLGTTYRAGDPLNLHFQPIENEGDRWSDGVWRVAGREWNSMTDSACAIDGELTCLSCHSMHDYASPADQLAEDALGDGACVGCHSNVAAAGEAHTHHPSESEGARCVNCHMPRTSYALFTAIADHRIASPRALTEAESDRPNACNLCHLDRTLAWASAQLTQWYGQAPASLTYDESTVPAGALWGLSGDAVQRSIAAWHMGYPPAMETAIRFDATQVLSWMLDDPYAAVRFIASASLEDHGIALGDLDVFEDEPSRSHDVMELIRRFGTPLGDGALPRSEILRLRAARDNEELWLAE
ncbi:MAG: hypothetical protein ACJAYU_002802 [Bradymonadia bacterium]|jgi:hypothetical protein